MRVILVDDHPMLRTGLKRLLEMDGAIQVVAEAGTAEGAFETVRKVECDVLVTDLVMPGKNGIWLTEQVRAAGLNIPILMLTMHRDEELVLGALKAGANGYLLKTSTHDELIDAVGKIHGGGYYLSPEVAGHVIERLRAPKESSLTARERQVLQLASEGQSNERIADALALSLSTIKAEMRNAFRKLGVADRTSAVVAFLRLENK
ncbi:MAG TPA: response regulator transcription factor [Candidatus Xenobia bacterium]